MEYKIRTITSDDKNFIYDVKKTSNYEYINRIWGWDEDYQTKEFETSFGNNLDNFRIISVNGFDVGFVQLGTTDSSVNITEIHITPNLQGKSIGSNILREIILKALLLNKIITIGCFKENERAKRLYLNLGFSVIKVTDTHYELQYIGK